MERVAAGELAGPMSVLYDRYGSRLYGLGLRLLGEPGVAEDMVQETFVRLWRSAGNFEPGAADPAPSRPDVPRSRPAER